MEDLGIGFPLVQHSTDRTSRHHVVDFLNQSYGSSLLGKYWCQVINTTADPDQPLMRSNVFTLLAPGDYSESLCTAVQSSHDTITCADLSNRTETTTSHLSQILKTATTLLRSLQSLKLHCQCMLTHLYPHLLRLVMSSN